jgi:signal transduction histidine kinase
MRARLADPHARAGVHRAPGLQVERELEPFPLGERGVGYPDEESSAFEPLDRATRALQESDEVAGVPRVVEMDLHGPLRNPRRAARRGWTHGGGRGLRAKLARGAGRPPRTNGNTSAGTRTAGLALVGVSVAGLVLGSLAVQAGPTAHDRIVAVSVCIAMVLLVAHGAALAHRLAVDTAVARERRRIARELHDGLAQELVFVVTQCSRLASEPGLGRIAEAAESALAESLRAMVALRRPVEAPLAVELERVAKRTADRAGLRLELRLAEGVDVPPAARAELARVVHEAIANTARHAGATSVCVELSGEHGTRLTVSDDGIGFDPDRPEAVFPGFGILGMRERVQILGGELRIESRPLLGTRVEVLFP